MSAPPAVPHPARRHRVCFVAPFGLGQKTTVWARTLPLARILAQHGWDATIVIPPWDTPGDAGKSWRDDGVELVNVDVRGGIPGTLYRLLRAIDAREPDIVHIVKPRAHAGLAQWLLWQRRRHPPLLLDIDDWEQAWAPVNRYPWPVARVLAWQEEWGIRHADGITAASRWLEQRARQYNPGAPICYLPNGVTATGGEPKSGVHTVGASPGHPAGAPATVLYFTRFVEVTPAWLAQFWRTLHDLVPVARLVVAGAPVQPGLDEPFRSALADVAPTAAGQVSWLGFVPGVTQPAIYAAATCAIFPAMPSALQEAKCSVRLATTLLEGVPVVASAVGEQAHYGAAGAAHLVPATAPPGAFAAAVASVLADPAGQASLGSIGRARLLSTYAWPRLGQQLADFYANFV